MYLYYNGIYFENNFNVVNEWQLQFILDTLCEVCEFRSHVTIQQMTYAFVSHGICGVLCQSTVVRVHKRS